MTPKQFLERRSADLSSALEEVLQDPTFPPHARFRGKKPPTLGRDDAVVGVRVIYAHGDWIPFACGLSHGGHGKCGSRPLIERPDGVAIARFDPKTVEAWITRAWRAARHVAPHLRGFVNVHDTIYTTDMDTGVRAKVTELGIDYL